MPCGRSVFSCGRGGAGLVAIQGSAVHTVTPVGGEIVSLGPPVLHELGPLLRAWREE